MRKLIFAAPLLALALVACEKQDPAAEAAQKALDDAKQNASQAVDSAKEAAGNAKDAAASSRQGQGWRCHG